MIYKYNNNSTYNSVYELINWISWYGMTHKVSFNLWDDKLNELAWQLIVKIDHRPTVRHPIPNHESFIFHIDASNIVKFIWLIYLIGHNVSRQ